VEFVFYLLAGVVGAFISLLTITKGRPYMYKDVPLSIVQILFGWGGLLVAVWALIKKFINLKAPGMFNNPNESIVSKR
jgi:hypothetical protein